MQHTDSVAVLETAAGAESKGSNTPLAITARRRCRRDSGAMLLAVLFMMAMLVIFAMAMAPSFVQQAKRDREEEMIHRGTEYARAIKKYYKKFGRYPANLEQLDNTNQIRFLRRRFKDPLTKDGQWKLLHYGDISMLMGANPTALAGQLGGQGGTQAALGANQAAAPVTAPATGAAGDTLLSNTAPSGAQLSPQQPGAGVANQSPNTAQAGGGASPFGAAGGGAAAQTGFSLGQSTGQPGGVGGSQAGGTTGQTGSNNTIFGNTGVGGQTFGGGAIVGVASKDKDPTIRVFNKKKNYDEWMFIYSPAMDRVNVLLRGPYDGQSFGGTQIGIPAGQLNQPTQNPFGQQPGGLGQQNSQQNQQLTPGTQYPPEQVQPHQ
jgi:type II secretory pathway pseudopilin PulG